MFNDNSADVKAMIEGSQEHALGVGMFATISGIKGNQFGREIFSCVIKFKDLRDFLNVFPDVQRDIKRNKVVSIKKYILSGLDNLGKTMRFFPAITTTARGNIFYDESSYKIAIDAENSKLSVNDGQHRFFGVAEAIDDLKKKLEYVTDKEQRLVLANSLKQLEDMSLPMTIFNNLSEAEEKQLFHDTNYLAQRPSRSSVIRLVQTDYISKIARELAVENRYLKYYGVEMDKSSIQDTNPNTFLLTNVHTFIQRAFWDFRKDINERTYPHYKEDANDLLDRVFYNLPGDANTKDKYILNKNYTLQGIAMFIYKKRKKGISDKDILAAIKAVNWEYDIEYWKQYGGHLTKGGYITFGSSGQHGRDAVIDALEDNLPGASKQLALEVE